MNQVGAKPLAIQTTAHPKEIKIIEVGPRDGLQNEALNLSTEDKLAFIEKLITAGHTHIEATAFVSPKWVPQMADATEVLQAALQLKTPQPVHFYALVPNTKGLERALKAGLKEVAVFTAVSETFNQKNTNLSISDSFNGIAEIIKQAQGLNIRGYLSTCFTCPYEGKIQPEQVLPWVEKLLALGVTEVSLGDTIGAATPKDVQALLTLLFKNNIGPEKLALHMHDTYGTALANVVKGLEMGIITFDSSSGGLGGCPYAKGASGNLATEDLVYCMEAMGVKTGINLEQQAQASLYIQQKLGKLLPSKQLQRLINQQITC